MSLIDDPILNSPFHEPIRHFKFDEDGITNEIVNGRRPSSHFVPIPRAKKKGKHSSSKPSGRRIESNPIRLSIASASGSVHGVRADTLA